MNSQVFVKTLCPLWNISQAALSLLAEEIATAQQQHRTRRMRQCKLCPGRYLVSTALALTLALLAPSGAPAAEIRVSAGFDNGAVYLSDPDERFLEIEVVAPERGLLRRPAHRPRLNIALVVDKSGSMAEARKIDFVREAAHRLVDQLQPGDRFALVTYDDQIDIPIPSEAFEDRRHAHRVIDGIRPGGATNLGGGLIEGLRQVRRYNPEGINRVLLLSDGLANRGIPGPERGRAQAGAGALTGERRAAYASADANADPAATRRAARLPLLRRRAAPAQAACIKHTIAATGGALLLRRLLRGRPYGPQRRQRIARGACGRLRG